MYVGTREKIPTPYCASNPDMSGLDLRLEHALSPRSVVAGVFVAVTLVFQTILLIL